MDGVQRFCKFQITRLIIREMYCDLIRDVDIFVEKLIHANIYTKYTGYKNIAIW